MGREMSIMWGLVLGFHHTGKPPLAGIASDRKFIGQHLWAALVQRDSHGRKRTAVEQRTILLHAPVQVNYLGSVACLIVTIDHRSLG